MTGAAGQQDKKDKTLGTAKPGKDGNQIYTFDTKRASGPRLTESEFQHLIHGWKKLEKTICEKVLFAKFLKLSPVSTVHYFIHSIVERAMPLFGWMKWSPETKEQNPDETKWLKGLGVVPSCLLITELLWHVEERERLARQLERERRLTHNLRWFQKYPRLQTLIPSTELHQLEFLCAQIQPMHTAVILSRFRELLATNNVRPWELAAVFKQVLMDFLSQSEDNEEDGLSLQLTQYRPMEAWTSRYKIKQGFVTPTVPNCGDRQREEIPTVSGYVDRVMRHSGSFTPNRVWDLPYFYPGPLETKDTHDTTL